MMRELKKELRQNGARVLTESWSRFFKEHGDQISGVKWRQYTPYFNDGDECVFSVHDLHVRTVDPEVGPVLNVYSWETDDPEDEEYSWLPLCSFPVEEKSWWGQSEKDRRLKLEAHPIFPALVAAKEIHDDYCELGSMAAELVGNHVEVVVTQEKMEVSRYEHG